MLVINKRLRLTALTATAALAATSLSFSTVALAQTAESVVAELNGTPITYGEVAEFQNTIPNAVGLATDQILPRLIEFYIDQQLIQQAAEGRGLENDPQVIEQLERLKAQMVQQAYLRDEIADRVTEDKIRAEYEKRLETMVQETEVRARHILVKTEDEAEAILREISDGANFEDVAREKSTGPSGPQGGDLGYFVAGTMVPEFSEAAFAMEPGEVSAPVQTDFGWHVIKVEDRRMKPLPTYEELLPQIRDELSNEAVEMVMTELRGRANITIAPSVAQGAPAMTPVQ